MRTSSAISTALFASCILFAWGPVSEGQAEPNQPAVQSDSDAAVESDERARPRLAFVKTAEFYLRNGELAFGKLIDDDKNHITIEQLEGSDVVVKTYSRMEIDGRTLYIKNVPEYKHYLDLADYFSGRTWDFKDDPDDFMHALRAYENAKRSAILAERRQSEIDEIDQKIQNVQTQMDTWQQQMQARAKLKELEFKATFEEKLNGLQEQLANNSQLTAELAEGLDRLSTQVSQSTRQLDNRIASRDRSIEQQLKTLAERIQTNRNLIETMERYWYDYRPYYYPRTRLRQRSRGD